VDREKIQRLESGFVDADLLNEFAVGGRRIRTRSEGALERLATAPDWRGSIAAVLLGDQAIMKRILSNGGPDAQIALLSVARAGLIPLPLDLVMELASRKPSTLAASADRYLEAMDTTEAREAFWALHPGEIRIVGMPTDTAFHTRATQRWEERLRQEMLRNQDLDEIVAIEITSNWGPGPSWVLRQKRGKAYLTASHQPTMKPRALKPSKATEVLLPESDAQAFLSLISKERIDDLPPLQQSVLDAPEWTYLHLTRRGGKRIYMNFPQSRPTTPYGRLAEAVLGLMPEEGRKASRPFAYTAF
jgi:hypothetical protein